MMGLLQIIVSFLLLNCASVICEWEPCVTLQGNICKCTPDYRVFLCQNSHLNGMPKLEWIMEKAVVEMHISNNNISEWPKSGYWNNMTNLQVVDATFNPICVAPAELPHRITVLFTACTSK